MRVTHFVFLTPYAQVTNATLRQSTANERYVKTDVRYTCSERHLTFRRNIDTRRQWSIGNIGWNAWLSWKMIINDHCHGSVSTYRLGLKRVLGYLYSGRYQMSTRYCRPTRVLGIYNDRRKLCCKVACGDYFKAYTSRPLLSLLLCSTYLQYLRSRYFIEYARTYVFLHDFTYETHEKRTGWPLCSINQKWDSL